MFIKLTAGAATLEDADNFRAFNVKTDLNTSEQLAALKGVGRLDGGHVWVDPAWLRAHGRPGDAEWLSGLAKMLDYAKSAGWVDEAGGIRAHIEN